MEARLAVLDAVVTSIVQEVKAPLNFIDNFAQLSIDLTADLAERLDAERSRLSPGAAVEIQENLAFLGENAAKIRRTVRRAGANIEVLAAPCWHGVVEAGAGGARGRASTRSSRR